jgi:hypothetical protein
MKSFRNGRPRSFRGHAVRVVALRVVRPLLYLLLLLLAGHQPARPQENAPSEYQVKAAFLFNFGKFVGWPAEAFTNAAAPLVIGVYGGNPFHHDLEQLVAGKQIGGHPVAVRQIPSLPALKECHVVFLNTPVPGQAAEILATLHQAPVLTVTENVAHFQGSKFMINFMLEHGKIRFEINQDAARLCRLKISSKLLTLARPPEN